MKRTAHRGFAEGFTLMEVLASIAILTLITLAMARIFGEATSAFEQGTNSASRDAAARAAAELIVKDLEGLIVDTNLTMYKEGDESFQNYDRICFVTMNGSPNDERSLQQVQYYVRENIDLGYRNYRLFRATRTFAQAASAGEDPFEGTASAREWWATAPSSAAGYEIVELLGNVVRFDVWANLATNGMSINIQNVVPGTFGGAAGYDSRLAYPPPPALPTLLQAGTPPTYFDVYLQVTSDDIMKKAGRGILSSTPEVRVKSYTLMYRNSNALFARAYPNGGSGERRRAMSY